MCFHPAGHLSQVALCKRNESASQPELAHNSLADELLGSGGRLGYWGSCWTPWTGAWDVRRGKHLHAPVDQFGAN